MKHLLSIITMAAFILIGISCSVSYSFTGASIPVEAKTISISYFPNQSLLVVPTLSQTFTDALKDRFVQQTPLDLIPENGDIAIEGVISDYTSRPTAIQGNDVAALNRLTITVKVKCVNKYDDKQSFERSFSRFADYSSSQNLNSVQDALIEEIVSALTEDIFNNAVVNW
ncbi:MAG: LPS assembly lipoprotein LptE [Sphingobacteriia bacterium]|nr:LPS assembly lipoprotein LptE [Sphingobacteriia bacterium]